jgi:hypothetical protein
MDKLVKKRAVLGGLILVCFLLLVLLPAQSQARKASYKVTPPLAKTAGSYQYFAEKTKYIRHGLDVNDFRVPMTNYAIFGQFIELGAAGGEWPKGSNEFYIFGAGIWVGGTVDKPTLQTLAFENFNAGTRRDSVLFTSIVDTLTNETATDFNTDPRVALGYNPSGGAEEYAGLTDIFISDHPEDYADPDFWPLRDDEGNALIVGIEDSYCEFDDQDPERWDMGAQSNAGPIDSIAKYGLGVKVIQRTHSWNYENNKTMHFFVYQIVNIREDKRPIRNCFLSIMCDPDVGPTANDDLVGFDYGRNLGYCYDSDFAEQGFARIPGYLAYKFLESPMASYDVDLNGDDEISDDSVLLDGVYLKDIRKGETLGLTSFKTSNLQSGDPDTEPEKYIIMAGHNYPDVGSQEYRPFDLGTGTTPVDQRFFQSTGPFLLAPVGEEVIDTVWYWNQSLGGLDVASIDTIMGDTVRVVVAVMMGPNYDQLLTIADQAQAIYDIGFVLPRPPDHPDFVLTPDDKKVYITWDDAAERSEDPYFVFTSNPVDPLYDPQYLQKDFEGYKLYRSTSGLPGTFELLAQWDKASFTPRHANIKQLSGAPFEGTVSYDEANTEGYILAYGGTALFAGHEYLVQVKADTSFSVTDLTLGVPIPVSEEEDHWYNTGEPPYVFELFDDEFYSRSDSAGVANGTNDKYFDGCNLLVGGMVINFGDTIPGYVPSDDMVWRITGFLETPEGDDSELAHAYVDTGLTNGVTYYYDVIAYDFQPFASPRSLENGLKGIPATPHSNAAGYSPAVVLAVGHTSGQSDGSVTAEVVDPLSVTGHDYKVTFDDSDPSNIVWHLIDITETPEDTVLKDQTNQAGDDDYLVADGILVRVSGPNFNIKSIVEVQNAAGPVDPPDNVGYSWNSTHEFYVSSDQGSNFTRMNWQHLIGIDDWEFRFTADGSEYYSWADDSKWPNRCPFEVWNIGPGTADDDSDDKRIQIFTLDDDGSGDWSPGDRIYPCEREYPTEPLPDPAEYSFPAEFHIGRILFNAGVPATNTVVRFITNKPNASTDVFTFSTRAALIDEDLVDLDQIKVVPNPYIVRNNWERSRDYSVIAFTHLPDKCTIRIYTLAGDHLRTLEHESDTFDGNENWNLLTKNRQKIAAGIYIYHVESPYGEAIGKFAVVR